MTPSSSASSDRSRLITEQQLPASRHIDRMSSRRIVELMNAEDAKAVRAVGAELDEIAKAVDIVAERFRRGGRLVYVGAGTSGRLGVLDASECPPTFGTEPGMVVGIIAGGDTALKRAIEGAEDHPEDGRQAIRDVNVTAQDCVLGIATSGTTPFVLAALEEGRLHGAAVGFLTCNPGVNASVDTDFTIRPVVGPEIIAGSTRLKSGTATKLVLNMITTGAMIRLGKVYGNLMVDLRVTNNKLQDRAERLVCELCGVDRPRAVSLLAEAEGHVKTALIMHHCAVGAAEARKRLEAAQGFVEKAIEPEPRSTTP